MALALVLGVPLVGVGNPKQASDCANRVIQRYDDGSSDYLNLPTESKK